MRGGVTDLPLGVDIENATAILARKRTTGLAMGILRVIGRRPVLFEQKRLCEGLRAEHAFFDHPLFVRRSDAATVAFFLSGYGYWSFYPQS